MSRLEKTSSREIAVMDIGSNSVRLVIYETSGAHFTPIFNEKVLAGLGRDLRHTGRLSVTGREQAIKALSRFQRIIKARRISKILIGATAALRKASDAKSLLSEVKIQTGLNISPISGEEEARLSAMGVISSDKRHAGLVADLGGASLELIQISSGRPGDGVSLTLGPFDVVGSDLSALTTADYETVRTDIDQQIEALPESLLCAEMLYLVGGAWRNLASIHQQRTNYPMRTLQDYRLSYDQANSLGLWAYGEGRETVLSWPGLRQARAETLPYSGLMLTRLLNVVKPQQIIISTTGLREGLVYDALPDELQAKDGLFDGCRDFAYGAVQTENFGEPLMTFMTPLLETLGDMFGDESSPAPNNMRMAKAASLLAGLGKNLHPDYRPELVFNDVLYAPVAGLTHPERAFLALTLLRSYSHKRAVPNAEAITLLLTEDQISAACMLGEIIRLGIVAAGHSSNLLQSLKLKRKNNILILSVSKAEKDLITKQVEFRLKRVGKLLGCETETRHA